MCNTTGCMGVDLISWRRNTDEWAIVEAMHEHESKLNLMFRVVTPQIFHYPSWFCRRLNMFPHVISEYELFYHQIRDHHILITTENKKQHHKTQFFAKNLLEIELYSPRRTKLLVSVALVWLNQARGSRENSKWELVKSLQIYRRIQKEMNPNWSELKGSKWFAYSCLGFPLWTVSLAIFILFYFTMWLILILGKRNKDKKNERWKRTHIFGISYLDISTC